MLSYTESRFLVVFLFLVAYCKDNGTLNYVRLNFSDTNCIILSLKSGILVFNHNVSKIELLLKGIGLRKCGILWQ